MSTENSSGPLTNQGIDLAQVCIQLLFHIESNRPGKRPHLRLLVQQTAQGRFPVCRQFITKHQSDLAQFPGPEQKRLQTKRNIMHNFLVGFPFPIECAQNQTCQGVCEHLSHVDQTGRKTVHGQLGYL